MRIQMLKIEIDTHYYSMLVLLRVCIWFSCFFNKEIHGQIEIHFKVVEESPTNSIIGNIHNQALKQKGGVGSGDYYYKSISDIEPFFLESRTYEFRVAKRVDREEICKFPPQNIMQNCRKTYQFIQSRIMKDDKGQSSDSSPEIIVVNVEIIDINDNSPKWSSPHIYLSLPEHSKIGTEITLPLAMDPDQPPTNTTQKYKISYQSVSDGFNLKHSGRDHYEKLSLIVNKDFDREKQATVSVKLKAFDGDPNPLSGQLNINISLTDINDKQPHFKQTSIHKIIKENIPLRSPILQLEAKDEDESDQHKLRFEFDNSVDETVKNRFYINPLTGEILTAGYIDYEIKSEYTIPVVVTDGKHSDQATLTIEVKNVNDNNPEISVLYLSGSNFKTPGRSSQYRAYLAENKDPGFVVASLSVSDKDYESKRLGSQMNHLLDCRIDPHRESLELKRSQSKLIDHFHIITTRMFDREETSQYFAQLICFDSDTNSLSTSVTFEISITDVNDNPPIFEVPFQGSRGIHSYSIKEGVAIGTTIVQVKATDRDIGNNAIIQYSLDSLSSTQFSIDPISGELRNIDVFDFEKMEKFELTINASNPIIERKNSQLLYTLQKITVNIEDVNDCPPVFERDLYTFTVKEGPSKDVYVGKVVVKDDDISSKYNTNYFKIISNPHDMYDSSDSQIYTNSNSDASQYFRIGESGLIHVNVPVLDREKISSFSFKIQAADRSEKPLSSTAIIQIQILDVNDNTPLWIFPNTHNYEVNVSFQESIGYCIANLKANDPDLGDNGKVTYRIVPSSFPSSFNNNEGSKILEVTESSDIKFKRHEMFDLDGSTGNIYIAQKMKLSDVGSKKIWVEASDQGTPPLKKIERLHINIVNIDGNGHGSSQGQFNKRSGLSRVGFENDLMIMIVLVAIIILVAMVMVIIILMLRCRNTSRLMTSNKLCRDTCQSISASRSFLERRPDGHSCSPINDICPPYPGPKRSQTISTYLGQSAGSSQMFDLANGYLTDPNSRMQLDRDNCDSGMCQSMNRIPINRVNNSTFAKKYYTSSSLYRPNALWSNEGSPELSRRLCQKLNNNIENTNQLPATSPIQSEPSENTNDKERNNDFLPGNSTKKSITLPNFLTAIEECEDSTVHHLINDEPQSPFQQLSNYDRTQQRMSVTWLDKFNNETSLNANKKQGHQYKSADSCLNGPYLETHGNRDHEYTQLNVLPSDSTPVKVTHTDYPVTYV